MRTDVKVPDRKGARVSRRHTAWSSCHFRVRFSGPTNDGSSVARRIRMLGMLLVLFGCGWVPPPATAAGSSGAIQLAESGFSYDRLRFWIGGGLVLLGLVGVATIILFSRHRRLVAERDALEERVVALSDDCRGLNAEIERLRRNGDRQRELKGEIEGLQQNLETLRDKEQRFRSLTQQLPVGIFMANLQGQCHYVNDRWCQMSGLTADQAAGLSWMKAVHPDDRDQVSKTWRQATGENDELVLDHRFQSPSGRVTWLNTRAVPLRDRAGRVAYYLGANTDVADLKRTEETLRASEARFRSYFELPLVGIGLTGSDKRWWEVNDRLCEMLGYRRAQLLRLSWAELTHPDDLADDLAQFGRVMNRRIEGYSLDKRFLRQDGTVLYASVSTRCVRRPNGVVDYFVTVVQDIGSLGR